MPPSRGQWNARPDNRADPIIPRDLHSFWVLEGVKTQSGKPHEAPLTEIRDFENKARLAGQPGSEPRSPASWPKVGLKPLAVADP